MSDIQRQEAGRREQGVGTGTSHDLSSPQLTEPAEGFHVPEGEYPPPPEDVLDAQGDGDAARGGGDIDHVDIRVADVDRSRAFYAAALAPLGWQARSAETDPSGGDEIGFGRTLGTQFAIHSPTSSPGQDTVTTGAHIAFSADDPKAVRDFHAAALANGGRDIGAPGPRSVYGAGYYGAFVLDPDGNNIEAVWHDVPS
jgi:catechol 2,3-dioxygenase-like lactoylglutathione lyase family enzyme